MQMAKLALQVILTAISLNAFAVKEATLCRDCATLPEAKQFVLYLASVSSCGGSAGPSQPDCVLNNHQSTVLDIESGNAFSFDVQFNDIASGTATVNYRAISPRGIAGFRQLAEFVRAIESSIKKASTTLARVPATNQSTNVARSASTVLLPDNNCPSDTALAALLSPNRMEQIRTDAMVRLGAELSQRVNAKKLEGVIGTDEAAVTVNGERFVGSFGYTRPIGAYLVTFNDTERQSAVQDYLVYDVSIMGYGSDDKPAFNVALSGFSRAAGYSLARAEG